MAVAVLGEGLPGAHRCLKIEPLAGATLPPFPLLSLGQGEGYGRRVFRKLTPGANQRELEQASYLGSFSEQISVGIFVRECFFAPPT